MITPTIECVKMDCGCQFRTKNNGIIYDPDIASIPYDCRRTWDIFREGNTKGVFQLESPLGKSKSKQVQPKNIEELSDLLAIIRPGCKDVFVEGKSLTQHYIDRKHKKDPVEYFHDALEPILSATYGILVYQEQALMIARDIAGFDLQEADILRKAIGKKDVVLMSNLRQSFIEKSGAKGVVSEEQASEIFNWIEKSQRYSFNKSHSICYAYNAYLTAYSKAHFPKEFFTSYLRHATGKQDTFLEINELINNARTMGIDIRPPDIRQGNKLAQLINGNPTFGLAEIKGVGESSIDRISAGLSQHDLDISTCDWETFLILFNNIIDLDHFEALILSGALDCFKTKRSQMHHELRCGRELTKREMAWVQNYKKQQGKKASLTQCLTQLIATMSLREDRVETLVSVLELVKDPGFKLVDDPSWVAKQEDRYLGICFTRSPLDEYDTSR